MYNKQNKALHTAWHLKGLTEAFVKDQLSEVGCGYTNDDRYPIHCRDGAKWYPILPSYSWDLAYRDYGRASKDNLITTESTTQLPVALRPRLPTVHEGTDDQTNDSSGFKQPPSKKRTATDPPSKKRTVTDPPPQAPRKKPKTSDAITPADSNKKKKKSPPSTGTNKRPSRKCAAKTPSSNRSSKRKKPTPRAPKKATNKRRSQPNKKKKTPPRPSPPPSPEPNQETAKAAFYFDGVAKSHARKSAEHQSEAEELADQETVEKIQFEFAVGQRTGPNRIGIQSDIWHKRFPLMAKEYFGFETWSEVKEIIYCAFEIKHTEPTIKILKTPLNQFEQALIGLMLLESNLSRLKIANIFGYRSNTMISEVAKHWIPEWGKIGRFLSVLPFMDAETINQMESEKFVKLGLRMIAYIIDGKDFPSDTVRIDRVVNCAQQSTKLGRSAIRIITWGLPCGLTFEHTDGFLGRAGEKALVRLWASNGRLQIPVGFLGLGDKGFKGTGGFYINMNGVLYPAFLQTGTQFTQQQSGHSLACSQGCYSIEVFYSRVTNRPSVAGIIERNQFSYFDDLNHWAHGRANLYRPLQMPQHHKDFFGVE